MCQITELFLGKEKTNFFSSSSNKQLLWKNDKNFFFILGLVLFCFQRNNKYSFAMFNRVQSWQYTNWQSCFLFQLHNKKRGRFVYSLERERGEGERERDKPLFLSLSLFRSSSELDSVKSDCARKRARAVCDVFRNLKREGEEGSRER
jgi:hypothetical protein